MTLNTTQIPESCLASVSGSTFVNADCFDVFPFIEDKSIDAIICDLPYGTTNCKWDIIITFDGMFKANKFIGKIVDAVTGTTFTKRSTEKIKEAFDTVDDVLGIDTRGTLKGVVENGIASTLLKGLKKKK